MKTLIVALTLVVVAGCQINPCGMSKDRFLENYERFVNEVAEQDLSSDARAWKRYDDRFEQFTDQCYPKFEDKLSRSDKRKFASHSVRYAYHRYGRSFFHDLEHDEKLKEEMRELGENLGKYAEQLGEEFSDAINEFVQEIDREALQDAVDKARDFFENLEINIDYKKDKQ
ncbi:MAG: DUF6565 domain-containing protein [Saprospiraceae bacterium]|nr:DUF6565 domain-containing protein [Saprospiraceae bacterium]